MKFKYQNHSIELENMEYIGEEILHNSTYETFSLLTKDYDIVLYFDTSDCLFNQYIGDSFYEKSFQETVLTSLEMIIDYDQNKTIELTEYQKAIALKVAQSLFSKIIEFN